MKLLRCALLFTLFHSFAANAATVTTDLFSIEIPEQWHVEDNKSSILLAMGSDSRNGPGAPFLSVQYCVVDRAQHRAALRPCDTPCSEKALDGLVRQPPPDMTFAAVTSVDRSDGVAQYSAKATGVDGKAAWIGLICSRSAQVHLSLVSSGRDEGSDALFVQILASLKWK